MRPSAGEFDDDELWNYVPKARNLERDSVPLSTHQGSGAASRNPAPESGQALRKQSRESGAALQNASPESMQAPWKRSNEHRPFVSDVAVVQLSNKLALTSSRLSKPHIPPFGMKYGRGVVRLTGVAMIMVAGIVGYKLGSGLPASLPQSAPRSSQFDPSWLVPTAQGLKSAPLSSASPRGLEFIQKGRDLFANGNVAAARLFYERAAEAGLAEGALALAATFDSDELARRQVVGGVQPDPAAAWRWYERALELGARKP
jgi:TPR repeat protein